MSQEALASSLGLDQTAVSKYESGVRRLDLLELDRLCEAVGIPLTDFVRRYRRAVDAMKGPA